LDRLFYQHEQRAHTYEMLTPLHENAHCSIIVAHACKILF
jgi:hypothetical protein